MKILYWVEKAFADASDCTQEGGGIQETRAEYISKYKARVGLRRHPDGRLAIILNAAAQAKLDARIALIRARRSAGTATAEEAEIDDLPDTPLDASWDAPPPPPAG